MEDYDLDYDLDFKLRILEIIEEMQNYCNCKVSTNQKLKNLRNELLLIKQKPR